MKKRLLALLLTLMLVVGLLPVGAVADGDIYTGNETFSYHITNSSLQSMVDKYNQGETSDVQRVTITFNEPYTLGGQSTFQFRNGYTIDFSNTSDAIQPDDIDHLTITLENNTVLTVPGDDLDWNWVNNYPRRYDLSLAAGEGNCTVTFYVQNAGSFDNGSWKVYQTMTVSAGSTLDSSMPALPTQEDPDAHWIAWEIGDNDGDGRELHADSVITESISVYARKTLPSSGGEQIRVMGPEPDFIEILREKVNADSIEINGISAFDDVEETNPYYDPSRVTENDATENGWKNNGAYYRVMNTDQVPVPDNVPEHNDRVSPGELKGINIYATVDGTDRVITLYRNDLDVRVTSSQNIFEIYLREMTEPEIETPEEPEVPTEPADPTFSELSDIDVVVECTTDENHGSKTADVKDDTYSLHKYWDGDQWTCTVEITPNGYVADYIEGHTLNPETQMGTLLYIYDGSKWVYNGDGTPTVTFYVACDDEGGSTDLNGTAVTVKVYVDGKPVSNPYTYISLDRDNKDTEYNGWSEANTNGIITCDFNYENTADNGGFNCVDIKVTVKDSSKILQGVESYQSHGQSGTNNVKANGDGTFTIDNVTASGRDEVDVKIYLRTKYSVEYYKNDTSLSGDYTDNGTYIAAEDVQSTTTEYPSTQTPVKVFWQNKDSYATSIELKELPSASSGEQISGWYANSKTGATYDKGDAVDVSEVKPASGTTIKFYAVSTTTGEPEPETVPDQNDLAELKVRVNDNKNAPVNHGGVDFGLIDGCYVVGGIVNDDGVYTVTVILNVTEYAKQYDTAKGYVEGSHAATSTQGKIKFVFTWTDGEWVSDRNSVTIGVKCAVTAPSADELSELLQVKVKDYAGVDELPEGVTSHGQFVTGIIENTYSITGPTAENNAFITTVTLTDGSAYAAAYDENKQLAAGTHVLTTTVSKLDTITLTYDFTKGTWNASKTGWSLGVKCEPAIYTIHVSFVDESQTPIVPQQTVNNGETATPPTEDGGRKIVGWKEKMSGKAYTGSYDYASLAELVTENGAWNDYYKEGYLTFEAVYERVVAVKIVDKDTEEVLDDTLSMTVDAEAIHVNTSNIPETWIPEDYELADVGDLPIVDEILTVYVRKVPPVIEPYYTINVRFVDSDGTTALGGGDVISNYPDQELAAPDPEGFTPDGKVFAGWKVWLGNEPMYKGQFTYEALYALRTSLDSGFTWGEDNWTYITFQAVYNETSVEPDPDPSITGFTKTLVRDRDLYDAKDIDRPVFRYNGDVVVDEGEGVTLLYRITVEGTPGTEFTVRDTGANFYQTGVIPASGETVFYVSKNFSWAYIVRNGELVNTASVRVDGKTVKTDTERVDVVIDWDYNVPDDEDDDTVYVPNGLNTKDHYSYIVGYEDGTIRPENNITRAEVATIFYRLLTDSARSRWNTVSNSFTDVNAGSWYNTAVSTLSRMGIINGYEDGSFKPDAQITRAEFTAIATRFFDYSARYKGAFNDVASGSWYANYVQAALDMGLVDGYPDGGFHPNSSITRAEAVTIVNRVLNRVPHEDHLLSTRVMNTWPDNRPGTWYYADMQEATNSHDYGWIRVSGEYVENWTAKLTDPNW